MHPTRFAGLIAALPLLAAAAGIPNSAAIDAEAARLMAATHAQGLAVAVIDEGQVVHVGAYGKRNAAGDPLLTDTVMYGASLTKAVFAYTVMQIVEGGRLNLDKPIADYLPQALPDYPAETRYARWADLAGDERWRRITPRMTKSPWFSGLLAIFRWCLGW